jgi:large subunit ribosomal protein L30
MYAVIRLRGSINVRKGIRDTMMMLRLNKSNHCVLVPKNQNFEGMLKKVNDFVTWGEISPEMLEKLVLKRGEFGKGKVDSKKGKEAAKQIMKDKSTRGVKGLEPVFRLSPPSKGFRSTRIQFPKGDLGYRGEKVNELLKRMI